MLKPAVWTPMCTLYWSHSRLSSFKRDWGLSPADVFSEEGKHHCATVKANNQSHLQGPQRKLSTNDSVSPDTFALLPCKDNILLLLHKLVAVAVNMCRPMLLCFSLLSGATLINAGSFCQQKEEGKVQGQLNHTDSTQYIRDLKSQIEELKHEVRPPSLMLHHRALYTFSCQIAFGVFNLVMQRVSHHKAMFSFFLWG